MMASGSSARAFRVSIILVVLIGLAASAEETKAAAGQTQYVTIETTLPLPQFQGTPKDIRAPRIRPVQTEEGPPFLAPVGTKNVALGKPVTSSDSAPLIGELAMITDGDKEASDGSYVELGPMLQHVTIDLQAKHTIYGIRLWHYHLEARVYFDVIVQVSNDPNFTTGVTTVFNNDMDNSAGLGTGKEMHYVDTHFGLLIDTHGVSARYVRLYSSGSTANDINHCIEVEVYGKPSTNTADLVPLNIQYPKPMFIGLGRWQNVAYREDLPDRVPAPLMVPKGTQNVALGKPVSSNHPDPIIGQLAMITDSIKGLEKNRYVELEPDRAFITIDLQEIREIYAIAVWHYYASPRVYFDVIVQISNDPQFTNRKIVYNSKHLSAKNLLAFRIVIAYNNFCYFRLCRESRATVRVSSIGALESRVEPPT